jgi:DNA polymerase III subunit gamma/tau
MEKFIVSARKYRPQNFSTVIGQGHITTTLKNAIKNNQLAHAFLFCGPRGVGKTTCARILAKTINCENRTEDTEACNVCNSCVSFDNGTSLNIHELDAASNNSVDDIRTLVDQVRFAPQAGKYKVYIVDEVHMLSTAAFNAFLKTLEEPPPYAIFILATTEKHKIIPTILSRCQIFDFKRITIQDTIHHLKEICTKEGIKADKASLHVIAQKSEGCLRDALSILDKIVSFTNGEMTYANTLEHLNILDEDYYFKLIECMRNQNLSDAILMYDEINQKGFEGDMVLNGFSEFLRNVLICKDVKIAMLLEVAEDFKAKYHDTATKTDPSWIISALNILNESEINYKQARNKKLQVELTLIRLCYLQQALELVTDEKGVHAKKATEQNRPVAFRSIVPIGIPSKKETPLPQPKSEAKLIIETQKPKKEPILNVANEPEQPPISNPKSQIPNQESKPSLKIKRLEAMKKDLMDQQGLKKSEAKELTEEELYIAWGKYIEKLVVQNKPSVVTNFKEAVLKVIDNNCIEIITETGFKQKFIENERAGLIDHLQAYFNNKLLSYKMTVNESEVKAVPVDAPLGTKEQYLRMIEQYPLVKELKDRLNLELDY